MFFFKHLFIIPLVIFFIGISFIPMADSVLRPEIHQDVILTEKEKEEKFQRCLGDIPSDATVAERTVAEDECEHILGEYFTGSRAWNSIIDDHISFIRTCIDNYDIFLQVGEIDILKMGNNPRIKICVMMFNDPIWEIEGKDRMILLQKWYNQNAQTGKGILAERDREIKLELISSSKNNFEEVKTIQIDIKPATPEEEIEKEETKPDAVAEEVDRFDFKPEKQPDVIAEDDKFCFLFWCW